MKSPSISKREFDSLKALRIKKHRRGWWAVFSVNRREEVWPFVCYGVTPIEERKYVPEEGNKLLFDVARFFLSNVYDEGGRFFISIEGVFYIKGEVEYGRTEPEQFIMWNPDEPLTDPKPNIPSAKYSLTPQERMQRIKAAKTRR